MPDPLIDALKQLTTAGLKIICPCCNRSHDQPVWVDVHGQRHEIKKLSNSHLFSILRYLEKRAFLKSMQEHHHSSEQAVAVMPMMVKEDYKILYGEFMDRMDRGKVQLSDILGGCAPTEHHKTVRLS